MPTLERRVAVVTGGTRGVGRGVGRELAQAGARVYVTGRTAPDAADPAVTGIRCDHDVDDDAEAAFSRILGEAGPSTSW